MHFVRHRRKAPALRGNTEPGNPLSRNQRAFARPNKMNRIDN